MKLAIMQPYFMPYIGYFQAINAVDKYILYDKLTYILNGWVNRNRIRQRNSSPNYIIVPIKNKSSYQLISDVIIDNSQNWYDKMLRSISLCYAKSDYFDEVMPLLEVVLSQRFDRLSELNIFAINNISSFLDIKTLIESETTEYAEMERCLTEMYDKQRGYCFEQYKYLEKSHPEKKVARAIIMCKNEKSDHFINAIGGQSLYDKNEFALYDINVNFIQTNNIRYVQKSKNFEPNLSIIDVLMHNGKDGTKRLLNEYTLV